MKVIKSLIRQEREKRAWSQEHLAHATGLGLRTIQRIESSGVASAESALALASVFDLPVEAMSETSQTPNGRKRWPLPPSGCA